MTYGDALEVIKNGGAITRDGWNGKNMFVFKRPGANIGINELPFVQSLPASVKQFLLSTKKEEIHFREYICMFASDGTIINGWLASQTDMLCDDWREVTL